MIRILNPNIEVESRVVEESEVPFGATFLARNEGWNSKRLFIRTCPVNKDVKSGIYCLSSQTYNCSGPFHDYELVDLDITIKKKG